MGAAKTLPVLLGVLAIAVAGCSTTRDPHRPKLVNAGANGGAVTVKHGQGLWIPLASETPSTHEWRRVEPRIVTVAAIGAPYPHGMYLTPVRSGTETLRFEYRPLAGEGAAEKAVSYDITVP
jgi:hypothetical protein